MWPARWCSSPKKNIDVAWFWSILRGMKNALLVLEKYPFTSRISCGWVGCSKTAQCFKMCFLWQTLDFQMFWHSTNLPVSPVNIFERVWHGKLLQVVQRVPVINWSDLIRDPNWFFFGFLQVFFIFHRSTGGGTRFRGSPGQVCLANSAADDLFAAGYSEG